MRGVSGDVTGRAAKEVRIKTTFRLTSPTWIKSSRESDASLFKTEHNLEKSFPSNNHSYSRIPGNNRSNSRCTITLRVVTI